MRNFLGKDKIKNNKKINKLSSLISKQIFTENKHWKLTRTFGTGENKKKNKFLVTKKKINLKTFI